MKNDLFIAFNLIFKNQFKFKSICIEFLAQLKKLI